MPGLLLARPTHVRVSIVSPRSRNGSSYLDDCLRSHFQIALQAPPYFVLVRR